MASSTCMNVLCCESTSTDWKKGWPLRSGQFAVLCDKCGSAYEQSIFCDVFHSTDSGWRECALCGKRLHCGCIASRCLMELLDSGGVNCINCAKKLGLHPIANDKKPNEFGASRVSYTGEVQSISQLGSNVEKIRHMQLGSNTEVIEHRLLIGPQNHVLSGSLVQPKEEDSFPSVGEHQRVGFLDFNHGTNGSCEASKRGVCKADLRAKDMYESVAQTSLSANLGAENSAPLAGVAINEREYRPASSPLIQSSRSFHLMPKPPKSVLAVGMETNPGVGSQIRVARPPAEGRGRNQLLPRYWPRITDQELQQISGASNSTIVPLFEKMLSASDAGRIGRLVVPKACAEAYFPPISQPEGLPIRIQDVKGKEWVFQFRFWPNNNSRMYVLEGVTPCIQSMQLQAGDTVTFSRMDPEGKLIMGFRKASNSAAAQDTHPSAVPGGPHSSDTFFPGVFENLSILGGPSGLLQSLKGSAGPQLNALPKHMNPAIPDMSWHKSEKKHDDRTREALLLPSMLLQERKRARNIGSKSKRLLIDSQDAMELKLTWEEAQDLLRPPPTVTPSKVMVEDHEFEEYEEPPVFGKRSIFVARTNGGQEQWAQCDSCSKWRRLPVDVLLPSKWTCSDNVWDQSRSSCSASDELMPRELDGLLRLNNEFRKCRIMISSRTNEDHESSGLDALANAAILGDSCSDPGTASVATTTKHPRHRPGCSCIVCIQPPSGKGKHKPSCTCNVCMTVKRRFKTLMMRKKKRQSEREAEIAQRNHHKWEPRDETELDIVTRNASPNLDPSGTETRLTKDLESKNHSKFGEMGKGQLDLNCDPGLQDELSLGSKRLSMMSLLHVANLPLETYLKQNGLTSLISEPQASNASLVVPRQDDNEIEGADDDHCLHSAAQEQESRGEEYCKPDETQNQPE